MNYFQKPNETVVCGIAYTPEYSDNYRGSYFHSSAMNEEFTEKLMGKPVYIEHDTSVRVGTVVDAWIKESTKQAIVLMHIHSDDMAQRLLPDKLHNGFFRELSLGNDVATLLHEDGDIEIVGNEPVEVSIVRKGDRPDTRILDWAVFNPNAMGVHEFINWRFAYTYNIT